MQKHKLSLIEESSRFYQLIVESFNKKTVIMRTKEVIFSFLGVTLQKSQQLQTGQRKQTLPCRKITIRCERCIMETLKKNLVLPNKIKDIIYNLHKTVFIDIFIKVLRIYITISFLMEQDSTQSKNMLNNNSGTYTLSKCIFRLVC